VRDLLVAVATGHQALHLRFAFGQRLARRLGVNVGARARARFSAWRNDVAWQRKFVRMCAYDSTPTEVVKAGSVEICRIFNTTADRIVEQARRSR
jgi:hypothetical protein